MTEERYGMRVDVQSNVAVAVVECAHCKGTGTCSCDYCAENNFGRTRDLKTKGGYNKDGPCRVCKGMGSNIISKKIE